MDNPPHHSTILVEILLLRNYLLEVLSGRYQEFDQRLYIHKAEIVVSGAALDMFTFTRWKVSSNPAVTIPR